MKRGVRGLYVFIFVWFIVASAMGQEAPRVSLRVDSVAFPDFARQLQSSTNYFFYYPKAIDTLKVTVRAENAPLDEVLKKVLDGTDYRFALDRQHRVFVTHNRTIITDLPTGFFGGQTGEDSTEFLSAIATGSSQSDKTLSEETKLYEIGLNNARSGQQKANLAGHITEAGSGEPVVGAVVYGGTPEVAVTSDAFGYYSITLPVGRNEIKIRSLGMKDTHRRLAVYGDGKLDIEMDNDVIPLKEVVIEAEKDRNVSGLQMGNDRLDIRELRQVPTALGETDILRVAMMLPGVQSVGESSTGLNVRGGATDQNLILFNGATIYNPSHLFGFFSAFDPDVLKGVELYKSGVPAEYGGRLSSILDIDTRDGNNKTFAGSGGIGLVTSRLSLEGPIIKNKASFIVGGRTTYSDWLLSKVPDRSISNSRASFYDFVGHLSYSINEKNDVYLTFYQSADRFRLNSDTLYQYTNQAAVARWKHIFKNKLYSVVTGSYSGYDYGISSDRIQTDAFNLNFGVKQVNLKADFNYFTGEKHTIDFGASSTHYSLSPGNFTPLGDASLVRPEHVQDEAGLESAVYIGDRYDFSRNLSLYGGLRFSLYDALGPKTEYRYATGFPLSEQYITDTTQVARGKSVANYSGPELRFSARYAMSNNTSLKLSYNRMRQYVQRISNTTSVSPTDIWKLSDEYIKPEVGDQVSAGIYRNFKSNTIEVSLEAYYKKSQNVLDYKGGAQLILNHHLETDVINADGKAYGVEFLVKKSTGKVNGWLSYTYSRSFLRSHSDFPEEQVNQGAWYPSNYDKPHDVNFIGNYRFSRRFSVSLNLTYSTGRPITLPLQKYPFRDAVRLFYSERNEFRISDYYRADFSMNIEGNHKVHQWIHNSWSLGVYNLTGRKNVYSVYFVTENGVTRGYQLSIFGRPIPTITYDLRF